MSQGEAAASIRHSSGPVPSLTLLRQGVIELLSRRRLVRYLVQAEMKKRGSDTFLGNLWWILDPILQMVVYVVFITIIGRNRTPDYPLFIFAAIVPWKWYSSVLSDAATAVARQEKLIRQIAFPKLVLPTATTVAGVVGFAWGLLPLLVLVLLHRTTVDRLSIQLLWLPLIAGVQFVFTLASAILIAAANVFFRDLGNAVGHALRLWWFLSPGLYTMQSLLEVKYIADHPWLATLASLNPFSVLFEAYHAVIWGSPDGGPPHMPDLVALMVLLAASTVFLCLCVVFFKRVEPDFAKVL
ncbi:MAG TPA: ABC transporter permease [Candidatus Limnocylindrales bacterium]|nr:ABC transporter permease [Candidatus Limnocylindrales bacterium]